jgi:hypothetical protein
MNKKELVRKLYDELPDNYEKYGLVWTKYQRKEGFSSRGQNYSLSGNIGDITIRIIPDYPIDSDGVQICYFFFGQFLKSNYSNIYYTTKNLEEYGFDYILFKTLEHLIEGVNNLNTTLIKTINLE